MNKTKAKPKRGQAALSSMTGRQLQQMLDAAGLSQVGAAAQIGLSDRQMRRYIAGAAQMTKCVEYALRWLAHIRQIDQRPKISTGGNK